MLPSPPAGPSCLSPGLEPGTGTVEDICGQRGSQAGLAVPQLGARRQALRPWGWGGYRRGDQRDRSGCEGLCKQVTRTGFIHTHNCPVSGVQYMWTATVSRQAQTRSVQLS